MQMDGVQNWQRDYIYEHMDIVSEADAIMCGNDDIASRVMSSALAEKRLA